MSELAFYPDAYNTLGEHLSNDPEQARWTLIGLLIAAIGCSALVVWSVLS